MSFLWISLSLCGFHRTGVLLVLCLGSLIPKDLSGVRVGFWKFGGFLHCLLSFVTFSKSILWSSEVIVRVLCSALAPGLPCVVRYHANEQLSWPCVLYMNEIKFCVLSNIDFLKTIPSFPFQMDDGVCIFELDSSLMCTMSLVAKGKCYKLTMFFFLFSWFVMYKHVVSMDLSFTLWTSCHSCCACFMPRISPSERVSFAHVLDLWCQSWLLEVWGFPSLFVVICYHRQVSAHCVICSKNMQHLKALCGHFRDLTDSSVVSCPDRHPQRWCEQFSCFLFDSSRGFPGEGPTWTCRRTLPSDCLKGCAPLLELSAFKRLAFTVLQGRPHLLSNWDTPF